MAAVPVHVESVVVVLVGWDSCPWPYWTWDHRREAAKQVDIMILIMMMLTQLCTGVAPALHAEPDP